MAIDPKTGTLDLGNDKLNINTTNAKGLEKAIGVIGIYVINAQEYIDEVFYGKDIIEEDKEKNGIQKALDEGLIKTSKELASFDFCAIFNFLINQASSTIPKFDPTKPPKDPNELRLWKIQKKAFDYQSIIDEYYGGIGTGSPLERLKKRNFTYESKDGRTIYVSADSLDEVEAIVIKNEGNTSSIKERRNALGLLDVLGEINLAIDFLLSKDGLADPEFRVLPKVSNLVNYLTSIRGQFTQYVLSGIVPAQDLKNISNTINKVRFTLILIQSINKPGAAVSLLNNLSGGKVQEEIAKLNKIVTPGPKVITLIKDLLSRAEKINSVAKKTLNYINIIKVYVKLFVLLIKVFNAIRAGIFAIAQILPAMFSTEGVGITFGEIYQEKLNREGIIKFIKRLEQIKGVLTLMSIFVTTLVAGLTILIANLRLILLNIQSCYPDLANDIQKTIDNLEDSTTELQKFLNDSNEAKNRIDNTFGGYTIEIVTEQVVDEGINLKRRYGIARGANGIIAVQSTPTFASLDLIIINEVKVLLISNGLVNMGMSSLSSDQVIVLSDVLNYISEEGLSINNIEMTAQDLANLTDSNDQAGISSFVNNLPGGKAFRKKVRSKLALASKNLSSSLKSTDPNNKYTSNIIKK